MVPKPFPYPLGIGIDVCKVPRVASFLRNQSLRNRWARKTFTRLEWPALWDQFQKTRRVTIEDARHVNREDWKMDSRENLSYVQDNGHIDKSIWMLPYIPTRWFTMKGSNQSEAAYNEAVSHERSPIGLLARHLAGRYGISIISILKRSSNKNSLSDGPQKKLLSKHTPTGASICVTSPSSTLGSALACFLWNLPRKAKPLH